MLACLGSYLEPSGIFNVLVETECFGTDVIKTVISGTHYSRARTAHSVIHEVLTSLMLKAFLSKYPEKHMEVEALQVNCQLIGEEWNTAKKRADKFQEAFEVYLKDNVPVIYILDHICFRPLPNFEGSDQFSALWRLDSLPQCSREGNITLLLFWENKLLSMDTIILAGLL